MTRPGARILLSSYAAAFWPYRLDWFQRQAARGLASEVDLEDSRENPIVSRDDFRSGALNGLVFAALRKRAGIDAEDVEILEVDGLSLYYEWNRAA